jgi:hypothetical protein
MEKRLDAEQRIFDMKDEMERMRRELAIAGEKYSELKGEDVSPLLEAVRDLQAEAITVGQEYYELMDSIPDEPSIAAFEFPDEFCGSCVAVIAHAQQCEIENRQLRILLNRFARAASMYHRIVTAIARYPILSTEDLGTETERGSWILPADVEHLQRAVIKLHDLLIRRGIAGS